jgi:hypothetical protein
VRHRHFVVVFEDAVAVGLEDGTNPNHAERLELRGTKRAHAGAAEDVNALAQRPENLLVPHRGDALEVAVDEADRQGPRQRCAVDVALGGRRQTLGAEDALHVSGGDRWASKDHHAHRSASGARRAPWRAA